MKMTQSLRFALLALFALTVSLPGIAQKKTAHTKQAKPAANTVVFYRCVDRAGNVSLQNDVPCAKGQKQTTQVPQKPATPVFTSAPINTTAPAMSQPAPHVSMQPANAAATPSTQTLLPPPPLYRCYTPQQRSYLSDNGAPKPRCIPLTPANADPNDPNTPKMCDMQQDTCERIPDQEACASWAQYDREARALVEMGNPEFINEAIALSGRTRKVMSQSTCADNAQNP